MSTVNATSLLQSFAPTVNFHPKEQYYPIVVDTYVVACSMKYTRWGPDASIVDKVTTSNINQQKYSPWAGDTVYSSDAKTKGDTVFYLELQQDNLRYGVSGSSTPPTQTQLDTVPYYGNAYPNAFPTSSATYCDLIYGFFYAYDDSNAGLANAPAYGAVAGAAVGTAVAGPAGTPEGTAVGAAVGGLVTLLAPHEGDWEHVIVRIGKDSQNQFSASSPVLAVFMQAHGSGDKFSTWYYPPGSQNPNQFMWKDPNDPRRVQVFASLGSHGSYATAGEQVYIWDQLKPYDETASGGLQWYAGTPIITLITMNGSKPLDGNGTESTSNSPTWNDYNGKFGDCFGPRPAGGPHSPATQKWLKVNSQPGGPKGTTTVTVAPTAVFPSDDMPSHSRNFKLDFPGRIAWTVEMDLSAEVISQLDFYVVGDKNLVYGVKHGMSVECGYQLGNVRVVGVTLTTSEGTLSGDEVFKHLGIQELILQVKDASEDAPLMAVRQRTRA